MSHIIHYVSEIDSETVTVNSELKSKILFSQYQPTNALSKMQ